MPKKTSEEPEESELKEHRKDDPKFKDPFDYLTLGLIEGRRAQILKEVQEGDSARAVEFLEKSFETES